MCMPSSFTFTSTLHTYNNNQLKLHKVLNTATGMPCNVDITVLYITIGCCQKIVIENMI